jgi:hypothetical protein
MAAGRSWIWATPVNTLWTLGFCLCLFPQAYQATTDALDTLDPDLAAKICEAVVRRAQGCHSGGDSRWERHGSGQSASSRP